MAHCAWVIQVDYLRALWHFGDVRGSLAQLRSNREDKHDSRNTDLADLHGWSVA